MDIQKIKELALANGFKLKEQASGNMDLNAYVYDFANAIEQAAKAQADQKIKLLLCDEHLKKCESPTGVFNSQYPDEEPCLICLAKEAKAQAVPEGYVLIKDDTKTVVAIERMVEQQVEASGMDSRRLERLDGWKIIEAAVEAQEPAND